MDELRPKNVPTVFVIFGSTGDLMTKKIIPALFHLYSKDKLPKLLRIIGFSRRDWKREDFQGFLRDISLNHMHKKRVTEGDIEKFLELFDYQQGNFDEISYYNTLASYLGRIDGEWKVCSNKLFYLAVPPQYYRSIFENLSESGLTIPCGPDEGWTRILVEKPFGRDLDTAQELDRLLAKLFREEQLYRIDHYLAKEMLQNIISFRFANSIFEEVWDKDHIEKIEIRLLEDIGVGTRGAFYDGVGALRDVGQNHLLQMLSLITMNQPKNFTADEVRAKRAEVLKNLHIPDKEEIKASTFRGQYEGYKKEPKVSDTSQTETYFKIKFYLDDERWEGVPIIMESGKALFKKKEIVITFKHPAPCLCPPGGPHYMNRVIFTLEPKETISVEFWAKRPGLDFEMEKQTLNFLYRDYRKRAQYVEEYEKLLLDCITGNQLLFVSTDEVGATWKFIDPILKAWHENVVPLISYKKAAKDVTQKSAYIETETDQHSELKKRGVGVIGLGKMGGNIARRLVEKGWRVIGYNRTADDTKQFEKEGGLGVYSIDELVNELAKPRIILLSLPAGKTTEEMLFGTLSNVIPVKTGIYTNKHTSKLDSRMRGNDPLHKGLIDYLEKGDIIIDGANAFYKESAKNAKKCKEKGIEYLDTGISGGPGGARTGACIMVGGKRETFETVKPLFTDMATTGGVQFFEGDGAGHFVKMVHNGIEYGMMQALAEGFAILKKSPFKLDLTRVTDIYNHRSVIESRLVGWLKRGFETYGEDLEDVSPKVAHTGEGSWTVETGKEFEIETPVISDSLKFRIDSAKKPSYTGKVLSALRNMFGGHSIK